METLLFESTKVAATNCYVRIRTTIFQAKCARAVARKRWDARIMRSY